MSALSSATDCHDPRLELSVTVNGRPASPDPLIRTGASVRVVYRLTNAGDRDIEDIRLTVPAGAGGTVVCPSGDSEVPELEEHSSVVCVAVLSAAAGSHDGTVTATGRVGNGWPFDKSDRNSGGDGDRDDWDRSVTVSSPVGYQGVGGLISATDSVSVTPTATGGRATFAYTVTDAGNLPVYDFSLSDPLVPAGRINCTGLSSGLQPGAVAHCGAVVDLTPGPHNSTLSVTANDRTPTAGADGGNVPPPTLSASAAAGFTVVALPPPPPPTPSPTPVPPPPSTPPPPVPSPTPTPPPSPTPSPTPTPTPSPTPTPVPTVRPTPPPPPRSTPAAPSPSRKAAPPQPSLAQPPRPGIKTPLFLLVMMVPAAGAAAVLAARRK